MHFQSRLQHVVILAFIVCFAEGQPAGAQPGSNEEKITSLLAQLSLEEEIRMLSGSNVMASTGIERLHIPAFRMSDGPMGAHVPPPSTAYAAGIG